MHGPRIEQRISLKFGRFWAHLDQYHVKHLAKHVLQLAAVVVFLRRRPGHLALCDVDVVLSIAIGQHHHQHQHHPTNQIQF